MTAEEARGRVQRGAALLDAKRPGWAEQINIDTLEISGRSCVLYQLGGYHAVASAIGAYDDIEDGGAAHGFFVPRGESAERENPTWDLLTAAWVQAITARRLTPVSWTHRVAQAFGVARGVLVVEG
jgi:hypothetical protein